jgi:hypothetical protein
MIMNGNPFAENKIFDSYIAELISQAQSAGNQVTQFVLREKKVRPSTGCFNCWLKTPGLCSINDDGIEIARNFIASDHVIMASPLIMGFVSALLKNSFDRNVPLIHPHLEDVGGEAHHKKRYDKYPNISFLLQKEPFTDDEDIAIVSDIFRRESVNLRTTLGFISFIDSPVQEVINAINIH